MTIIQISFTSSLQISEGLWHKCGVEAELSPDDDFETSFQLLKDQVDEVQRKFSKPSYHPVSEALGVVQVDTDQQRISGLVEAIISCTTLKALERFAPMVERENVDILYETYNNKKKLFP